MVRFAVGTPEHGCLSSEWFATGSNARSNDLIFGTKGLARDLKVTFHARDAVVGFVAERGAQHRLRGLLRPGESRQITAVPIQAIAWVAAKIEFLHGTLRPTGRGLLVPENKPLTLLPPPPEGHMLRVYVVHCYDDAPNLILNGVRVDHFARLESNNRHLGFFAASHAIDQDIKRAELKAKVAQIQATPETVDVANRGDLAGVLWGANEETLHFIEVHNIVAVPRITPS